MRLINYHKKQLSHLPSGFKQYTTTKNDVGTKHTISMKKKGDAEGKATLRSNYYQFSGTE